MYICFVVNKVSIFAGMIIVIIYYFCMLFILRKLFFLYCTCSHRTAECVGVWSVTIKSHTCLKSFFN